jgi:aryl-alcohol dehydrogenase-like predicted oxidoreductase
MPDRQDMIPRLRRAVDLGVTFFDTAEIYGLGRLGCGQG